MAIRKWHFQSYDGYTREKVKKVDTLPKEKLPKKDLCQNGMEYFLKHKIFEHFDQYLFIFSSN